MKLLTFAIATLAFFSSPLLSAAEEKTPALRLIELMDFKDTAKDAAMLAMDPILQQLKATGIPDEGIEEVKEAAASFFAKIYANPELTTDMAKVYENSFSNDELEDLILFYDTPVGRKWLLAMPQITEESIKVGQKYAMQNQAEFQAEIQDIMVKHMAEPPVPEEEPPVQEQE